MIAGQPQAYLAATLKAFQMGTRQSGYMQSAAARYREFRPISISRIFVFDYNR